MGILKGFVRPSYRIGVEKPSPLPEQSLMSCWPVMKQFNQASIFSRVPTQIPVLLWLTSVKLKSFEID